MNSTANDEWTFTAVDGTSTKVTWKNYGDLGVGIPRYFGLNMNSMLGDQFEQGLNDFKKLCEE